MAPKLLEKTQHNCWENPLYLETLAKCVTAGRERVTCFAFLSTYTPDGAQHQHISLSLLLNRKILYFFSQVKKINHESQFPDCSGVSYRILPCTRIMSLVPVLLKTDETALKRGDFLQELT